MYACVVCVCVCLGQRVQGDPDSEMRGSLRWAKLGAQLQPPSLIPPVTQTAAKSSTHAPASTPYTSPANSVSTRSASTGEHSPAWGREHKGKDNESWIGWGLSPGLGAGLRGSYTRPCRLSQRGWARVELIPPWPPPPASAECTSSIGRSVSAQSAPTRSCSEVGSLCPDLSPLLLPPYPSTCPLPDVY